jgi:ATP-dependent Clp protease, protease subunit
MPVPVPAASSPLDELGILFLSGPIDPGLSGTLCEKIVEFNLRARAECIQLVINSNGGDWHAGFALVDLMVWSRLPVHTVGVGLLASMALVVFMAGRSGHRVLTPHTSLLSHSFRASGEGTRAELLARRGHEDWMQRQLIEHYQRHTRLKTEAEITGQLLREGDTWLTPQEAVDLGMADRIQTLSFRSECG